MESNLQMLIIMSLPAQRYHMLFELQLLYMLNGSNFLFIFCVYP